MRISLLNRRPASALIAGMLTWSTVVILPVSSKPNHCTEPDSAGTKSSVVTLIASDYVPVEPVTKQAPSPALKGGADSTMLQGGTQSTSLQSGTQSTTLQTGTQSTMLQMGTASTTLQTGTQTALIQGQVEQAGGPINILFLVDASFSMRENLGGGDPKMTSAKKVLESALSRIPPDINLGLRVFGQSASNSLDIDCNASALLVPIGQGNRRSIIEQVRQLRPFGMTPLTYGLMKAEQDLRTVRGPRTIILISDGAETCGGDPCQYISRLQAIGIKIKVDIVGLGLKRERIAQQQLNCIAEKSGGKYYDANTAAELVDSISRMVSNAISGKVITKMKQPSQNTETPPDLAPIVPMTK